jgi:hypothetical protein
MQAGQIIATAALVLLGGYIAYRTVSRGIVQKRLKQVVGNAEIQNKQREEAISVAQESIAAARENTTAVRELTVVIRQFLETQEQRKP